MSIKNEILSLANESVSIEETSLKTTKKKIKKRINEENSNIKHLGNGFYKGIKTLDDLLSINVNKNLIDLIKRRIASKDVNPLENSILVGIFKKNKVPTIVIVNEKGFLEEFNKNKNPAFTEPIYFTNYNHIPDYIKKSIKKKKKMIL